VIKVTGKPTLATSRFTDSTVFLCEQEVRFIPVGGFCIACNTIECFSFMQRALFIFEQTNMIKKSCFCSGRCDCVIIQPFFSYNYSFPLSYQILLLHFPIHGNWRLAPCFRSWCFLWWSKDESRNAVENTVPSG